MIAELSSMTDDQRMLADTVATFVERELKPHEDEVERLGEVPVDLVAQIKQRSRDMGLYAVNMPEEHGGGGLGYSDRVYVEREFGRTSRGLSTIVNRPAVILMDCEGDQIDTYLKPVTTGERFECFALTEPGSGSDARGMKTTARRDGDDYVLNGTKHFITNAILSDFIIVFAVTGQDETPRGPRPRITSFLVDKALPGVTVTPMDVMSNRGMKSCFVSFDEVRVPARNILGEEGAGFKRAKKWLFSGRICLAACNVGLATRALSEAAQWANERVQFGQPIARFQGTGFKFADGAMEAHLAWLAIVEAAKKMDEGTLTEAEASAANLFASEMLGRATDNALQVLGGMGMSKDAPFERYFRDARVERIWEGTSEIHRHIISKYVLDGATGSR